MLLAAGLSLLGSLGVARADVGAEMRGMFNNLGVHANVDGPSYITAHTRNVVSGGSLNYRVPRDTYQLLSVTPPSIAAGCGGIDVYAGSFSFINRDNFVRMMRNIAANSVGLAFKTALCSTSANLCQAVEDLQKTVQSLNNFNIDSCEAAQSLVGGLMGGMQQSSQQACHAASREANLASDNNEARLMCSQPGDFARARARAVADPVRAKTQPIEFVGGNLVWQALNEVAMDLDREDREFLMSMMGTHVVSTVSLAMRHIPPTVNSIAELHEREITVLRCDTERDCLNPVPTAVTLSMSFLDMANTEVEAMRTRLQNGQELTPRQLNLVAGAPVPVLAILQADMAGATGLASIAGEAIAYSLAHSFTTASLRRASAILANWQSRSVSEARMLGDMVTGSRELRMALATESSVSIGRVGDILQVNESVVKLRKELAADVLGDIGK